MGRKIPGKRHRGVKDPYQQQLNKHALVKDKINLLPANLDEQPIPESLKNIIEWQQLAKDSVKRRRNKHKGLIDSRRLEDQEETLRGMTRPDRPTPAFIQLQGESDGRFQKRVDRICDEAVNESKIKSKDDFDVMEGSSKKSKQQKANIDEVISQRSDKNNNKRSVKKGEEPKLTKKEKLKLVLAGKKQAKLAKMQEKLEDSNRFLDHVAFGDVVHAPPTLSIPRKNQVKAPIESKPGRRGLLLQQILKQKKQSSQSEGQPKKNKHKFLPIVDQERQERNRLLAVQAYRKLKLQKNRS